MSLPWLSAYSLTERSEFLEKAQKLGNRILRSAYGFNASDTGGSQKQSLLPLPNIDLVRTRSQNSHEESLCIAEASTLQLEFRELSFLTGDPVFRRVSTRTISAILDAMEREGRNLFTDTVTADSKGVHFTGSRVSLGARGDSFLEYLIKQAVQDPSEARYRTFARRILDGVFEKLVFHTKKGTTFIAELSHGKPKYTMDHLVCFLPGALMLATHHFPKTEVDPRWETLAANLTETCHKMYTLTDSHLAPELTLFDMNAEGAQPDMLVPDAAPWNLLRPEAAEALFYMHYYTGNPKYRTWADEILTAFEKHSKGKFGFTSVDDVRQPKPKQRDSQESFFLAETLKYLYLVFAKPETLNLDKFVLNTEAHPLKLIGRL
jgi:mannosyl-oligosaccharide alpha-1,2-mannosidase